MKDVPQCFEQVEGCFCQLLNIHGINDIRQTGESLVFQPSFFEVKIAAE